MRAWLLATMTRPSATARSDRALHRHPPPDRQKCDLFADCWRTQRRIARLLAITDDIGVRSLPHAGASVRLSPPTLACRSPSRRVGVALALSVKDPTARSTARLPHPFEVLNDERVDSDLPPSGKASVGARMSGSSHRPMWPLDAAFFKVRTNIGLPLELQQTADAAAHQSASRGGNRFLTGLSNRTF
jgi:hypothetical protein